MRIMLLLLFVMFYPAQIQAENPANFNFDPFVDWIEEATTEKAIPGVALAIVSSDGILHLQTWGVKSVKDRVPISTDSIFRIASISKTFAGAATSLMIDQQLESWDTRIDDLFPKLQLGTGGSSKAITLKHVLSHSTGLMPHSYSNMLDAGVAYEKIKEKFHQIPTVCSPGDCYGYQNVVFSLVGDVIEHSTGESYASYLRQQLFEPLGMITASVGLDSYLASPKATSPHRYARGAWHTTTTNQAYYSVAPASGINASIFDMSTWLRANLGGFPEVLPPAILSELHEPVISTPYGNYFNRWAGLEKAYYGIGWRIFDYKGMRAIHHGGGVRGYRSEMAFVPEANIGMVLLFNAESNLANEVVPMFLDTLLDTWLDNRQIPGPALVSAQD